jgi:chorismate mutase/prephenate dehydratase
MELSELRVKIDDIDKQLVELFCSRMEVASQVAEYKRENKLPVLDSVRERQLLGRVSDMAGDEFESYTRTLYSLILELSRSYQSRKLNDKSELRVAINEALENTPKLFPQRARVACQGVEGANSQFACEKLFKYPNIMYFKSFEKLFSAVESGLCDYAILPVENSTAGSVNSVYDLMKKHNFHIVRSARIKIDHNLLAKYGTNLENVKEIFSHEQAIGQCADYLKSLGDVKVTVCENTAMAAKFVSESERDDVAALSSRQCAELYGLKCLASSVQDRDNNFTRFICISKSLEVYPGADRTSLMMITSNKPGSLYKVLARFYTLGINLVKLESRPLPDRDFESMFYFDVETPVYSPEFSQLLDELKSLCEEFRYLGTYSEMI